MKKRSEKERSVFERIDVIVRGNSFIITALIIFSFIYLNNKLGNISDVFTQEIIKNTKVMRENIGRPIFLTANGQVLVGERNKMGYADNRFINYVESLLTRTFYSGLNEISKNKKLIFRSSMDIARKNKELNYFCNTYLLNDKVILTYLNGIFRGIIDKSFPETIMLSQTKMSNWRVNRPRKDDRDQNIYISGRIDSIVVADSWIIDLKKYYKVKMSSSLKFKFKISVNKWGSIDNPFGIKFVSISLPVIKKPTARSLTKSR